MKWSIQKSLSLLQGKIVAYFHKYILLPSASVYALQINRVRQGSTIMNRTELYMLDWFSILLGAFEAISQAANIKWRDQLTGNHWIYLL